MHKQEHIPLVIKSIHFFQQLLKFCLSVLQGYDPLLVLHQQLLHRIQASAPHHLHLVGKPSQQHSSIGELLDLTLGTVPRILLTFLVHQYSGDVRHRGSNIKLCGLSLLLRRRSLNLEILTRVACVCALGPEGNHLPGILSKLVVEIEHREDEPKKVGVTVCLVAVLCGKVNVTGVDRDVGVGVVPANHPQARILGLLTGSGVELRFWPRQG